jgi:hypothetical protein
MSLGRNFLAVCLVWTPVLSASAASGCKPPQVLHSMPMVPMRDGRPAIPVMFDAMQGTLILDSAGIAVPSVDKTLRKKITNPALDEMTAPATEAEAASDKTGVVGTLTRRTARQFGLALQSAVPEGPSRARPEKVFVPKFYMGGLSPFNAHFAVSADNGESAEYSGTFSINNFRQFSFDIDLDFGAKTVRFFSREHCDGRAVDWISPTIAAVSFTVDGNGFIRFPAILDGKKVKAILGTGAAQSTLDLGYAGSSFGIKSGDPSLEKIGDAPDGRAVYRRSFVSIAFGEVSIPNPIIVLLSRVSQRGEGAPTGSHVDRDDESRSGPPLIIGASTLRQTRLNISYDERRLYFAAAAP